MKLKPRQPKPPIPLIQQVRETPEVVQALGEEAEAVGISSTEALRQILRAFVDKPWTLSEGKTPGRKTAAWANIKAPQELVDAFTHHTDTAGISAAYLGSTSWWELVATGRAVAAHAVATGRADAVFAHRPLAFSGTFF